MDANTLVSGGSENNSRDTVTYTHNTPEEGKMEIDNTLAPDTGNETSHGNTSSGTLYKKIADTLACDVPQNCGNTVFSNEVIGRHVQSEHNTFVHLIYSMDMTRPIWGDSRHVYSVLNSPPATDYYTVG